MKVIAWGRLSLNSELYARALNADLIFFPDSPPYLRAALNTLKLQLSKNEPFIVQLPQGPLLAEAALIKKMRGCKIVADVHSGFLIADNWKGKLLNEPFKPFLKLADLILVHNFKALELLREDVVNKSLVVYPPWFMYSDEENLNREASEPYLVIPASFAPDEPIKEIIEALAPELDVTIYITGNWRRRPELRKYASHNIVFTGFLPRRNYISLISKAKGVISGTKREYTILWSAFEAVAYMRPLALNETAALKEVFGDYAFFFNLKDKDSILNCAWKLLDAKPNMAAYRKLREQTERRFELLKEELEKLKRG